MGLVAGRGVYAKGKYQARYGQHSNPYYIKWANMIRRCYAESYKKYTPAYDGCEVHESFLNFQSFMLWAEKQTGFGNVEYHLDKDILSDSNKIYGPGTCVFVPKVINTLLNNCPTQRGRNSAGVRWFADRGYYTATVTIENVNTPLGVFQTAEEAFNAYKVAKENNVKRVAEIYKDDIDPRVYQKLMSYEVTETINAVHG